jgi:hypothetical protein
MIKKLLLPVFLCCFCSSFAQLGNSWIDYNKTYYKFKVAEDKLCRIPQPALAGVGLGTTNADHFQLWRNGQQVRIFTSVTAAPLTATDYIEFFGEMNDGKPDRQLYKDAQFQLADKYSLETDTAVYFLTVNPTSANLRFTATSNPAPSAGAVPEPYFMRKVDVFYRNQLNRGFAEQYSGEYVYSSVYDNGEGLVSANVAANPATTSTPASEVIVPTTLTGLNVYTAGPTNSLSVRVKAFFSTANSSRKFNVKVFNNQITSSTPFLPHTSYSMRDVNMSAINLPLSYLQNPNTAEINVGLLNDNAAATPPPPIENMTLANVGITYPATFNFNNEKSFQFELPASTTSNYLLIDNFNYGATAPVLYDLNTGRRFIGDIASTPNKVKFVLPASADPVRRFVLNSAEANNVNSIASLTTKTFLNLNNAANKGDYIIISNPILYNDGNGVNNVEQYRAYRATANGGGYNAKTYDINELTDQFAFGIKSHPAAIRDFVRFMDAQFTPKPKAIFIIGRGMSYYDKRTLELNTATYPANAPIAEKLDFVPTFGWPPSDILLASQPGTTVPITPIGRLGAINGTEVGYYLQKVLQYEQNQRTQSPLIADKAWMKNTILITGGKTNSEQLLFENFADQYINNFIKDTLFGGYTNKFGKTSSASVQQASSEQISSDFANGLAFVKYFGHSSATTFEFNLSDPGIYNNTTKYPFFSVSGCTAGNYYNFDQGRLTSPVTLSEKYILANQKGSIGFLADTHFGLSGNLHTYNNRFHLDFCRNMYGQTLGEQIKDVHVNLGGNNANLNYDMRIHLEQINLHGDPAIKMNNFPKPDYVIEPQLIKVNPSIITVADNSFNVKVYFRNLGRAINDSIKVRVKRTLPNNTVVNIADTLIFATRYMDSLNITVPINPLVDKGANKICVDLDYTNKVNELYETNNSTCSDFFIFENTLVPVYPYNYAIVNNQNITFAASTANPLLGNSNYVMELDTTELFNSTFKKTYTKTGLGGVIEFTPTNLTFTDSTVYYWRTGVTSTTGNTIWNNFSFVYLPSSTAGFNQSHYYQFLKNKYDENIFLNNNRKLQFTNFNTQLNISTGNFPPNDFQNTFINLGAFPVSNWGRRFNTLQFTVLDGLTGNVTKNTIPGLYGSNAANPGNPRLNQFEFFFSNAAERKVICDFIDSMPSNAFIMVYPLLNNGSVNSYVNQWQTDPASHNLYNKLKGYGFTMLDSFYRNIPMFFKFSKDNSTPSFQKVGLTTGEIITAEIPINLRNVTGTVKSETFGPAKAWREFHWRGNPEEPATKDKVNFDLVGITNSGIETTLFTLDSTMKDVDISTVDAKVYPYIQVKMQNTDSTKGTPYQLRYWRLNYIPAPEGAVAPNVLFSLKDTIDAGEPIKFELAFKNISAVKFDSLMKINLKIRTANNFDSVINLPKGKILIAGDTLKASYEIPSEKYQGLNTLTIEFNPNKDQPEQYAFNNILVKNFFVKKDIFNPLLDVTFDGVHILNRDIVSSKPDILIKLKDENKFLALRDTALLKLQLKFPGETNYRNYYFNNDSVRFTPATISGGENAATINFKPFLKKDGEYELTVTGRDVSGNAAGALEYHTSFTVVNEAKISEMLNYPNPFTTSTAFVFTLTGSEVPQNLRIQILTITGKVVKEITKAELNDIHIGRNITSYKWDGTDMYGQQLANGVYLYRVITNLQGKSLEKFKADGTDTDKYFNKGYGKMYLMR